MTKNSTRQKQINIRMDEETLNRIDRCRTNLLTETGEIPTRSDVVRAALNYYLPQCNKEQDK